MYLGHLSSIVNGAECVTFSYGKQIVEARTRVLGPNMTIVVISQSCSPFLTNCYIVDEYLEKELNGVDATKLLDECKEERLLTIDSW